MGPCITMLKHEMMLADECQDLVMVSLYIQIAIDKMQLCSLSIAYAFPYHKPNATKPNEVGYDSKLQSGQEAGEDDEHADELP